MFILMANLLSNSKAADGLIESIRYLLGPLKGGLGVAVILVSTVFAATTGIVMICLPIFLPILDQFGVDRLWICATLAVLMQTCFMTPPFGFALFFIRGIVPPGVKMTDVYKGVVPFLVIIIAVTILCSVFPGIVTALPHHMLG